MKLPDGSLVQLATMICGDNDIKVAKNVPYRSSSKLTAFFTNCDQPHRHDGSTRKTWVHNVLRELNEDTASHPDLPSDALNQVITEILNEDYFELEGTNREAALGDMNGILRRTSHVAFFDKIGKCHIRHDGTGAVSTVSPHRQRPLSQEESAQRERLAHYLDNASEDDFTSVVLVPFFQRLGFQRVGALGHREKTLEYGKDLWMKFQLPTGHWLYFCAQIKRVKIDAWGVTGPGSSNVAELLNQARMAFDHEIFDPDLNKKVLLDHLFVISAQEITRAARQWLIEQLDKAQRRHMIFLDREELLNHAARIVSEIPLSNDKEEPF